MWNNLVVLLLLVSSVVGQNSSKVVLTWTGSVTPGATYDIYRATVLSGPYTKLNASPIPNGTNTYTDTANLLNGVTYFYLATATANGLTSQMSQGALPLCFNCVTAPITTLGAQQQ